MENKITCQMISVKYIKGASEILTDIDVDFHTLKRKKRYRCITISSQLDFDYSGKYHLRPNLLNRRATHVVSSRAKDSSSVEGLTAVGLHEGDVGIQSFCVVESFEVRFPTNVTC